MVNGYVLDETGNVRVLDLRIVKIVEVIEDDHIMAGREQLLDKMRSNKTRAACHQNSHVLRSSTTKHTECTKKIISGACAAGTARHGIRSQRSVPTI